MKVRILFQYFCLFTFQSILRKYTQLFWSHLNVLRNRKRGNRFQVVSKFLYYHKYAYIQQYTTSTNCIFRILTKLYDLIRLSIYLTLFLIYNFKGEKHNFKKYREGEVYTFDQPYDYGSIMHYGPYDFARDFNRHTVIPLQEGVRIGQRDGFSKNDLNKINLLYNCTGRTKFW